MTIRRRVSRRFAVLLGLLVTRGGMSVVAQVKPDEPPAGATSFVPHRDDAWWWLSGQLNLIWQSHGPFTSPYQGDNSLRPDQEQALSRLWTVYAGLSLPLDTRNYCSTSRAQVAGV